MGTYSAGETQDLRAASAGNTIGIDIGGTKMLGLVLDPDGRVLRRLRCATPTGGNTAVERSVLELLEDLVAGARSAGADVTGIGIGAAGFVDAARGVVLDATNLQVRDLHLGEAVSVRFGLPSRVLHDVKAATLAEASLGAGVGVDYFAYLNVGTGIAVGFVLGGLLYEGAAGKAGEIGHIVLRPGGPPCSCGKRGCLEALASGAALAAQTRESVLRRPDSLLAQMVAEAAQHTLGQASAAAPRAADAFRVADAPRAAREDQPRILALAARAGDPDAAAIIASAAEHLGQAIAWLVDTLDLQRVVVGGGVAQMDEVLFDPLRRAADRYMLEAHRHSGLVAPSALAGDAGAIGAALAMRRAPAAPLEVP